MSGYAWAGDGALAGRLTDPQGRPVAAGRIQVTGMAAQTASDSNGNFVFPALPEADYRVTATAPGFDATAKSVHVVGGGTVEVELRFARVAGRTDAVSVTADVRDIDMGSPDPAVKVFAAEGLLDANPGRPGAPISIPGYPVETASGGIKAPQYFAPGVAGDHGQPIAQYLQVGGYLVPNNLSANAHGNGYADPNILIASVVESVEVDGGAFNVREGNHALNLGTTYGLRSHLDPFASLTGDDRDVAGTAGMSPTATGWLAVEGAYGNGFLASLEHRKQFKINGGQTLRRENHTLTLLALGYYGFSHLAGLSPLYGFTPADAAEGWKQYPDTIDPRQKDQTHTALLAASDVWKPAADQEWELSAFFRTYNLALYSDFGQGLIRQSEFRTVAGGSAAYRRKSSRRLTLLSGVDYQREAPRRDDLDHYDSAGQVSKVTANNVTIGGFSPYLAAEGEVGRYFHYYLGWRRDEITVVNQDLMTPANSSNKLVGVNSPKATLTFFPGKRWFVPEVAFSFGKSFFTEDPRSGRAAVETARSYQLVASKRIHQTDLKVTLGHEDQTAEYGKIDPDTGLRFDVGPGRVRYLSVAVRRGFRYGAVEAAFEQADARELDSGQVTPEAPRLIGDFSWTAQKLPLGLRAKGEFAYVGRKVVGTGCSPLESYCLGVANREFRLAVMRPFRQGRVTAGVDLMIARGYTGQTTENFGNDPRAEVVGVRMPGYASVKVSYRLGR